MICSIFAVQSTSEQSARRNRSLTRPRRGGDDVVGGFCRVRKPVCQVSGVCGRVMRRRGVRRSVSRVLSPRPTEAGRDGWPFIWDGRYRPPHATYPDDDAGARLPPLEASFQRSRSPLFGFAPGGVYHAGSIAAAAVRSYRTLSPLPAEPKPCRRFAFCGTFPRVAPAGRYPAPCFRGARTFLQRPKPPATIQPSDPAPICRARARGSSGIRALELRLLSRRLQGRAEPGQSLSNGLLLCVARRGHRAPW